MKMLEKDEIRLKAAILVWLWLFALVAYTGWAGAWGMIPLDLVAGGWMLLVAAALTMLIFGVKAAELESLLDRFVFPGLHSRIRFFRIAAFTALYLPIALFAWFLRSRNHFMGDGWAFIEKVQGEFFLYHNEPLDFFIHQVFQRGLKLFGITGGEAAYAVLHCLLFPAFLLVCWKVAGQIARGPVERLALWLFVLATAALQFFFGYVESYTLLHLWIAVYLLSGIRHFKSGGRENPWWPTVIFLLAAITHRSALALLPSLLFLWFERLLLSGRIKRYRGSSLIIILVSGLGMVFILLISNLSFRVPLVGPLDGVDYPYRLFSLKHFWDKLNFLLLICPGAVVAAPVLAARWKSLAKIRDPAFVFLFWSAAGGAFFFLMVNPLLGLRDWDLLSLPALPLACFCGWGLVFLLNKKGSGKTALFFLAAAVLLHSLTWVWINADLERGVRFLDRVARADYHRGTAKVQLGFMMEERGFFKEASRQYLLTRGRDRPKAFLNLVQKFWEYGMPDSTAYYGKIFFSEYEVKDSTLVPVYVTTILAYDSMLKPDSATIYYLDMMRSGLRFRKSNREVLLNRMKILAQKYNQLILQYPSNENILQFFLRYYTINQDGENLDRVYKHILGSEFRAEAWIKFLEFAAVCEQWNYVETLANEARRQHPDLEIEIE